MPVVIHDAYLKSNLVESQISHGLAWRNNRGFPFRVGTIEAVHTCILIYPITQVTEAAYASYRLIPSNFYLVTTPVAPLASQLDHTFT